MEEFPNRSRRDFIKQLSAGIAISGLAGSPLTSFSSPAETKLTVLHTNDVHSHIDPFEDNHPKYPGQGGAAARSALIKKIRNEVKNVLLLDAGDIFQGTPYFNLYEGELDLKIMSLLKYDAATMGNHDFDNGIEGFHKQLPHADFPFICSNYEFGNTLLNKKTLPYKIFVRDGIRIGVIGLGIELTGLVNPKLFGNTVYHDPVAVAEKYVSYLKNKKKCQLIICLSHLGHSYSSNKISDLALARKSSGIDLIIGGHTHTFLDEPVIEKNRDGVEVIVTQAGWAGLRLGRIDFTFKREKKSKTMAMFSISTQ